MRPARRRSIHRWTGIVSCFFVLMFCISGIILNHRSAFERIDVPRRCLPPSYHFSRWNNGMLRGTLALDTNTVLIYGAAGVFLTDTAGTTTAMASRKSDDEGTISDIRGVVMRANDDDCGSDSSTSPTLYAVDSRSLYICRLSSRDAIGDVSCYQWSTVALPKSGDERLSDITARGDTVVVVSRSHLYVGTGETFRRITLPASADGDGRVTLFRTVWRLHSGEMFGMAGRLIVDGIALVLVFLCVTGLYVFCRNVRRNKPYHGAKWLLSHGVIGRNTIAFTLFLCATGFFLRPPMMIPLVLTRTADVRFVAASERDNAWHDRLRMLRYDATRGDWLLHTSDGFYSLDRIGTAGEHGCVPKKVATAPRVSVMGMTVWQECPTDSAVWLCGSLGGMTLWDRRDGTMCDFFTGETATTKQRAVSADHPVAGYTADIRGTNTRHDDSDRPGIAVDYYAGTDAVAQPDVRSVATMSLWHIALEVHSGRFFFGSAATYFYVFVVGALILTCLWTGYARRRHP